MVTRTYVHDDLYPIRSKWQYREPACIVWLYYACSYTVAISPGTIPSFAVLHTEKLAFQYATLLSWECDDFRTFFFLHSVSVSRK